MDPLCYYTFLFLNKQVTILFPLWKMFLSEHRTSDKSPQSKQKHIWVGWLKKTEEIQNNCAPTFDSSCPASHCLHGLQFPNRSLYSCSLHSLVSSSALAGIWEGQWFGESQRFLHFNTTFIHNRESRMNPELCIIISYNSLMGSTPALDSFLKTSLILLGWDKMEL